MSKKDKFAIHLKHTFVSQHELYYKMIALYNITKDWGLSPTQINIIVYLIRHGYSQETKDIICENLKITESSLSTNLSYLRKGKVGKKQIKKLLDTSYKNTNVTLLSQELIDIRDMVNEGNKNIFIQFLDNLNIEKNAPA